jgi:ribosomal protein L11 methyltransferase
VKTSGVSQISVVTTLEAEEPVSALLERIYGCTPSVYTNLERGHSVATAYVRATPAAVRAHEPEVHAGMTELAEMGIPMGSREILVRKVRREDWSESWKKYFKTIEVGSALMIKPSWSKQKAKKGQAVVVLDPGLSFGTGQHATTSFCLKEIVAVKKRRNGPLSFLDIGSGSGILSISAARLGFAPVVGFDFDPVAVRMALKNCRSNRVDRRVSISRKDLTRLPGRSRIRFDLVCANLISTLLISEKERILNRLAPGGTLVLAGILATEFAEVRQAFEATGLRLTKTKIEREWQSGAFELS